MSTTVSANRLELLQIADAVAREKNIDRMLVIEAMEEAIAKAARSRYGAEYDIRAKIDPRNGELAMSRAMTVVEEVENHFIELTLEEARARKADAELGDVLSDSLPAIDFGRVAAQTAKQVIMQKVREAERDKQYNDFKDRVGDVVNGQVKRVEYGHVVADLGLGEAMMRRDQLIPREIFRVGDRVRALVLDVRRETRGPQVFLSRTSTAFMSALFMQEVPEIYDGVVKIMAVARDPGSRAKIGVISNDPSVDPVGACVGMRGSRVQAVVGELQGEKIDIIPFSEDAATFIVNALQPAEVAKVVLDDDAQRIEVVVPDEQLSLAIGRRGQNVRLASQLTGWDIDIMTETEDSERRQREFEQNTAMFSEALDVDEMVANLLVSEGFASLDEVAYVALDELVEIEGFDAEMAEELQARAQDVIEAANAAHIARAQELGADDSLFDVPGLTPAMAAALAEDKVLSMRDFAECADWELAGGYVVSGGERIKDDGVLEPYGVSTEEAQDMIMNARRALGMIEEEDEELEDEGPENGVEEAEAGEIEEIDDASASDDSPAEDGAEDGAGDAKG